MRSNSAILLHGAFLLLLATMGASLWLLLPTRANLDQARLTSTDSAVPSPAVAPAVDPSARWRAQLADADGELRSWRQRKAQVATELAGAAASGGSQSPAAGAEQQDAHKLAEVLAWRRADLERLELALPADGSRPPAIGRRPAIQSKEPVWLQLYAGRVLPVDDRYYSVRTIDAGGVAFRVLRRTAAGESYREAAAGGSKFQLTLAAIVPEKQYLQCLVAGDSFEILRRIMSIAADKGIDLAWDPYGDEDGRIVFTPRQRGGLTLPR